MTKQAAVNVSNQDIFADIGAELGRARSKFPSNEDQLVALGEEFGELSKALLQQKHEPDKGVTQEDIYAEAVQVAAMAIRVASEGDSSFPHYDPESGYRGCAWAGYLERDHLESFCRPECVFHVCPSPCQCRRSGCSNQDPNHDPSEEG
jgi:hypothetical protein